MAFQKGTRCTVCTGCGRCFGASNNLHILTDEKAEPVQALPSFGSAIYPENYYVAVTDIGTTTVAMELVDIQGRVRETHAFLNPQGEIGRDVISRIQAAADPGKAHRMQDMIRGAIEDGIQELQGRVIGAVRAQVIAGNTTMVYLLQGYDPAELGKAPFAANHLGEEEICLSGLSTTILPGFSAFVGGDLYAGVLATGMDRSEEMTLLIDLGTNGEMLLGNREGIVGCGTAAGPAFEGGANRGVFGADMVHFTAELLRQGYVDETGLLRDPYFEEGIRIGDVLVTEESIRQIQLAKAAIATGIGYLLKERGAALSEVKRVVLAGGFGYYLQPKDAAEIGLIPEMLAEKAEAGGNTALRGAAEYALHPRKAEAPVRIINLAEEEGFQEAYLNHINLAPFGACN